MRPTPRSSRASSPSLRGFAIGFAAVVAAVASPLVGWLHRRGLPGGPASAVLLLGIVALGVVIVVVIIAGITSQSEGLS